MKKIDELIKVINVGKLSEGVRFTDPDAKGYITLAITLADGREAYPIMLSRNLPPFIFEQVAAVISDNLEDVLGVFI